MPVLSAPVQAAKAAEPIAVLLFPQFADNVFAPIAVLPTPSSVRTEKGNPAGRPNFMSHGKGRKYLTWKPEKDNS